jgi:hypothetical protein
MITVGKSYLAKNGTFFTCVFADNNYAWMKSSNLGTAYVWTISGKSLSLDEDYDVNPAYQVTMVQSDD